MLWIARSAAWACEFASLLVVLLRHPVQYQARPLVDQAIGELPTVFGLAPKLLWRFIHVQPTNLC